MATTNFYLSKENKQGFSQVILIYQDKGKKFKYYTKFKVRKKDWKEGKLIKGNASVIAETNSILNSYKAKIDDINREAIFKKENYTIKEVELIFKNSFEQKENKEPQSPKTFIELFHYFIEKSQSIRAAGLIRHYKSNLNLLIQFSKYTNTKLCFEK